MPDLIVGQKKEKQILLCEKTGQGERSIRQMLFPNYGYVKNKGHGQRFIGQRSSGHNYYNVEMKVKVRGSYVKGQGP